MGPVFILTGGGRTGSTLVQRLFLSTRQVLVWGEHGGVLFHHLQDIIARMERWLGPEAFGERQRLKFLEVGADSWPANMNPPLPAFRSACKAYLDCALGESARELGYHRWGFKEIRYGGQIALFLQELYPDACFVLLLRHPLDCLRSIKSTIWYDNDPPKFLRTWAYLSRDLVFVQKQLSRALLLRYEDLIAQPNRGIKELAAVSTISPDLFDRGVFDRVLRGSSRPPVNLEPPDLEAIRNEEFRTIAEQVGYAIES